LKEMSENRKRPELFGDVEKEMDGKRSTPGGRRKPESFEYSRSKAGVILQTRLERVSQRAAENKHGLVTLYRIGFDMVTGKRT
jgi:hypothetical protein